MAGREVFLLLLLLWDISLLNVPCSAVVQRSPPEDPDPLSKILVCNESIALNLTRSAQVYSRHPKTLHHPIDCWLELSTPPHQVVSVSSIEVDTSDSTCSNWASFLDGDRNTTITDKVCFSTRVAWRSTSNIATVWYHTKIPTSALNLYFTAEEQTCPTKCDKYATFHLWDHVYVEPLRRNGPNCSLDSCYWKLCASLLEQRVMLHPSPIKENTYKCDIPQVQLYHDESLDKPLTRDGLSCEHTYTSSGHCMLVEYKLHSSSTARFHASVRAPPPVVFHESSETHYLGFIFLTTAVCFCTVVFGVLWCFRCQQIQSIGRGIKRHLRKLSTRERGRRQAGQEAAAGGGAGGASEGASTSHVAFIAGVTFVSGSDQPPSYSSLCSGSRLEEGPPSYSAAQPAANPSDSSHDASPSSSSPTPATAVAMPVDVSLSPPTGSEEQKKY